MKIGQTIQKRRKEMGLTQSEFAEICGLTPRSLQHYEENTREPSYEKLNLIATALGVTVGELFEESEEGGETVGERIRRYRKAAKLTQAELGRAINAAAITIRQYEIGAREPKLAQLQAVAAALGVPLTALVDDNIRTGGSYSGETPLPNRSGPLRFGEEGPGQSSSIAANAAMRSIAPRPDDRKEVIQMNELDRFRMAAEELELGDRAAILISRTLGKLQTEVMKLGDDCPGGAHRIEALSGILAALAPVLEKLGTGTDQHRLRPRNDPAGETKEAAPVVATPGRQTKKAGT